MSTMRATETFFHAGGVELGGTKRPDDHELVQQFPMFYEVFDTFEEKTPPTEAPRSPRGRRTASG